jgi:hypothetical protein
LNHFGTPRNGGWRVGRAANLAALWVFCKVFHGVPASARDPARPARSAPYLRLPCPSNKYLKPMSRLSTGCHPPITRGEQENPLNAPPFLTHPHPFNFSATFRFSCSLNAPSPPLSSLFTNISNHQASSTRIKPRLTRQHPSSTTHSKTTTMRAFVVTLLLAACSAGKELHKFMIYA